MSENKKDIELTCIESSCGNTFIFTIGEQEYFASRGLYPPRRCPTCRLKRKQENKNGQSNK